MKPLPPSLTEELHWVTVLDKLHDSRMGVTSPEVLIQWQNLPPFEATWELADLIQAMFPEFHLRDMVVFEPGGINMPGDRVGIGDTRTRLPIKHVYTRRIKCGFPRAGSKIWT